MKIVKVIGGLGNQMFQFALYKALQKQHPEERVLIDLHCFNGYHLHHGFEIGSVFGADYEEATLKEVARLAYPYPNYQTWRFGSRILPVRRTMLKEKADFAFEPSALTRQGDTYYDGYWQHEEYFKHIRKDIIELYQFKTFEDEQNKIITDKINSHECLSIHVRRGDYTNNHLYNNICTADYYKKAFLKMKEVCSFDMICIFSDDMEWFQRSTVDVAMPSSYHCQFILLMVGCMVKQKPTSENMCTKSMDEYPRNPFATPQGLDFDLKKSKTKHNKYREKEVYII